MLFLKLLRWHDFSIVLVNVITDNYIFSLLTTLEFQGEIQLSHGVSSLLDLVCCYFVSDFYVEALECDWHAVLISCTVLSDLDQINTILIEWSGHKTFFNSLDSFYVTLYSFWLHSGHILKDRMKGPCLLLVTHMCNSLFFWMGWIMRLLMNRIWVKRWYTTSEIRIQKVYGFHPGHTLSLTHSKWSQLPYCELPYGETQVAEMWGRPLANMQC